MNIIRPPRLWACVAVIGIALGWLTLIVLTPPRNDRDWAIDQAVSLEISISGDNVTIRQVRDFEYRSTSDYTPRYYDRTYDLGGGLSLWGSLSNRSPDFQARQHADSPAFSRLIRAWYQPPLAEP
jgi:hypothetical protein